MDEKNKKFSSKIDSVIKTFDFENPSDASIERVITAIIESIEENGNLFIPIDLIGESSSPDDVVEYKMTSLNFENFTFFPAYTNKFLLPNDESGRYLEMDIVSLLKEVIEFEYVDGIVLNPWSNRFYLHKETIKIMLDEMLKL